MMIQYAGYFGLAMSWVASVVVADNVAIAAAGLGALVAISTLMIRLLTMVDGRIESAINQKQADGELPTKDQWASAVATLEEIRLAVVREHE